MTLQPVRLLRRRRSTEASAVFDHGRRLERKAVQSACYAPFTSMYFDQFGDVRACCQNTHHPLGSVLRQSIREIWESAESESLRSALSEYRFNNGCDFCQWQVDEGGTAPFARDFDRHHVLSARPTWPLQMEFSMTNACNLQCVMCNGDLSSSIRAHRENRPPLVEAYGDGFFEELEDFLPHLESAKFLGGEPFLGKEPLRALQLIADLGLGLPVTVTTNGTQWSPRIERICERVNLSFVVSVDGVTKATYESIRLGADFDQVMANIDRFAAMTRAHHTELTIAHCLMRSNWHEFLDLLLWAEGKGIQQVGINSVVFPQSMSLYRMDRGELAAVVATLEEQNRGPAAALTWLQPVWQEQLRSLSNRLAVLSDNSSTIRPWAIEPWLSNLAPPEPRQIEEMTSWSGGRRPFRIRTSASSEIVNGHEVDRPLIEVDADLADFSGHPVKWFTGKPMSCILDVLRERLGGVVRIRHGGSEGPNEVWTTFAGHPDHPPAESRAAFTSDGRDLVILLAYRSCA